jgi:hypothetical protein
MGAALLVGCTSSASGPDSNFFSGLLSPPRATPAAAPAAAPAPVAAQQAEKAGCASAAECRGALKAMIESPNRGWIGQRQAPDAYADGTRLFAYRALRKQLTCGELTAAVGELQAAAKSMGGPGSGMTADQASRTLTLSTQVEGELTKERSGRCRTLTAG